MKIPPKRGIFDISAAGSNPLKLPINLGLNEQALKNLLLEGEEF